jgi:predicted ribosomally synthesized peptide with SipW-like signal peptide
MRKVLLGLVVIAMTAAAVTGATFAAFSDNEASAGNQFTTGTLDLYLNGGTQAGDSVTTTWWWDNMMPGEYAHYSGGVGPAAEQGHRWNKITLQNRGSMIGDHVEILVQNQCIDPAYLDGDNEESDTLDGAAGMDRYMRIIAMKYNGIDFLAAGPHNVQDLNGNGFVDLDDVEAQSGEGSPMDNLSTPGASESFAKDFALAVGFDASASNDYQGDKVLMTITFTLN